MLSENMKLIYEQRNINRAFEIHEYKLKFFSDLSGEYDYLIHNHSHILMFEVDEDLLLQKLNDKWGNYKLSTYNFSKSNVIDGLFIIREDLEEFYNSTKLIVNECTIQAYKRSPTKIIINTKEIKPLFIHYKKNIWLALSPAIVNNY